MIKKILCVVLIVVSTFALTIVPCFALPSSGYPSVDHVMCDIPFTFCASDYPCTFPSINTFYPNYTGVADFNDLLFRSYYHETLMPCTLLMVDSNAIFMNDSFMWTGVINSDSLEFLPSESYLCTPSGYSFSATLDDFGQYLLGNRLVFTYLLPKNVDPSTVDFNCGFNFDILYKSVSDVVGGGSAVDYSSENVNTRIGTSSFGQDSITIQFGSDYGLDLMSTEYGYLYANTQYFDVCTVYVSIYEVLNEYRSNYLVGDEYVSAVVLDDLVITPSLTVAGQDPSFYDWLYGLPSTDIQDVESVADEIFSGRDYLIALGFYDTDIDTDYQPINLSNYLSLMGGDVDVRPISLNKFNLVSWLGNTIGGVLDVPLIGDVSLGTVLYVCVGLGLAFVILKFFVGG